MISKKAHNIMRKIAETENSYSTDSYSTDSTKPIEPVPLIDRLLQDARNIKSSDFGKFITNDYVKRGAGYGVPAAVLGAMLAGKGNRVLGGGLGLLAGTAAGLGHQYVKDNGGIKRVVNKLLGRA